MIDMQVSILYINTCCKLYIIECQCKISGTNHRVNKQNAPSLKRTTHERNHCRCWGSRLWMPGESHWNFVSALPFATFINQTFKASRHANIQSTAATTTQYFYLTVSFVKCIWRAEGGEKMLQRIQTLFCFYIIRCLCFCWPFCPSSFLCFILLLLSSFRWIL